MDEGRIRKTIHIDMDAFYASVEQRERFFARESPNLSQVTQSHEV